MRKACTRNLEQPIENLAATQLRINEEFEAKTVQGGDPEYMCLVAAKILYFGVGGGVSDFLHAVEVINARVETVLERKVGVGRKVMRVCWA